MGLLNPLALLGALALAVPILVHLVRNDKADILKFSSLMFLLRIPRKTVRQHMLRNLLLMAVRLFLLILLIGAFARPYLVEVDGAAATTEDSRGMVVMMDNSYSMTYGTNFERMLAETRDRIATLTPSDRASLIVFSDSAAVLGTPTGDSVELNAFVDAVEPSPNRTGYYEAFAMADRALAQFEGTNRELVVITDFQRNGWNRSSREAVLDSDVQTEVVDLGIENPDNVGFESVSVDATVFTRTYEGQLLARINNYDLVSPKTVNVQLEINGRAVESRPVTIPAESSEPVEFTGFELALGYSQGRVSIENEDALMADNEFLFSVLRQDRLGLLVIDAGDPDQSVFFEQLFAAATDLPFAVEIRRVGDVAADDLDDYEVVIVNDVPRLDDEFKTKLDERRAEGQGQWVFLGENADREWWNGYDALPVTVGEEIYVERDRNRPFYSITTPERSHPVFAALEQQGARLSLNSARFFAYRDMVPDEGAVSVARFEDGSASIVESPDADPGLIVMGSTVDNGPWNDFPLKPSFFVLVHETVRYLAGYRDRRSSYQLGEAVTVGANDDGIAVITPDGDRVNLGNEDATGPRFFTPGQPGFYEVRTGPETAQVAVNVPLTESQFDRIQAEDLIASVQRVEGEARRAALLSETDGDDFARRQNWWWYLLLLALLAGIGEAYLSNRVTQTSRAAVPAAGGRTAG